MSTTEERKDLGWELLLAAARILDLGVGLWGTFLVLDKIAALVASFIDEERTLENQVAELEASLAEKKQRLTELRDAREQLEEAKRQGEEQQGDGDKSADLSQMIAALERAA